MKTQSDESDDDAANGARNRAAGCYQQGYGSALTPIEFGKGGSRYAVCITSIT